MRKGKPVGDTSEPGGNHVQAGIGGHGRCPVGGRHPLGPWGCEILPPAPQGRANVLLRTAFSGGTLKSLSAERRTKAPGGWDVNVGSQVGQLLSHVESLPRSLS